MKKGHWEVKDENGIWHEVTAVQAASYRLDGAEVRYVEEA